MSGDGKRPESFTFDRENTHDDEEEEETFDRQYSVNVATNNNNDDERRTEVRSAKRPSSRKKAQQPPHAEGGVDAATAPERKDPSFYKHTGLIRQTIRACYDTDALIEEDMIAWNVNPFDVRWGVDHEVKETEKFQPPSGQHHSCECGCCGGVIGQKSAHKSERGERCTAQFPTTFALRRTQDTVPLGLRVTSKHNEHGRPPAPVKPKYRKYVGKSVAEVKYSDCAPKAEDVPWLREAAGFVTRIAKPDFGVRYQSGFVEGEWVGVLLQTEWVKEKAKLFPHSHISKLERHCAKVKLQHDTGMDISGTIQDAIDSFDGESDGSYGGGDDYHDDDPLSTARSDPEGRSFRDDSDLVAIINWICPFPNNVRHTFQTQMPLSVVQRLVKVVSRDHRALDSIADASGRKGTVVRTIIRGSVTPLHVLKRYADTLEEMMSAEQAARYKKEIAVAKKRRTLKKEREEREKKTKKQEKGGEKKEEGGKEEEIDDDDDPPAMRHLATTLIPDEEDNDHVVDLRDFHFGGVNGRYSASCLLKESYDSLAGSKIAFVGARIDLVLVAFHNGSIGVMLRPSETDVGSILLIDVKRLSTMVIVGEAPNAIQDDDDDDDEKKEDDADDGKAKSGKDRKGSKGKSKKKEQVIGKAQGKRGKKKEEREEEEEKEEIKKQEVQTVGCRVIGVCPLLCKVAPPVPPDEGEDFTAEDVHESQRDVPADKLTMLDCASRLPGSLMRHGITGYYFGPKCTCPRCQFREWPLVEAEEGEEETATATATEKAAPMNTFADVNKFYDQFVTPSAYFSNHPAVQAAANTQNYVNSDFHAEGMANLTDYTADAMDCACLLRQARCCIDWAPNICVLDNVYHHVEVVWDDGTTSTVPGRAAVPVERPDTLEELVVIPLDVVAPRAVHMAHLRKLLAGGRLRIPDEAALLTASTTTTSDGPDGGPLAAPYDFIEEEVTRYDVEMIYAIDETCTVGDTVMRRNYRHLVDDSLNSMEVLGVVVKVPRCEDAAERAENNIFTVRWYVQPKEVRGRKHVDFDSDPEYGEVVEMLRNTLVKVRWSDDTIEFLYRKELQLIDNPFEIETDDGYGDEDEEDEEDEGDDEEWVETSSEDSVDRALGGRGIEHQVRYDSNGNVHVRTRDFRQDHDEGASEPTAPPPQPPPQQGPSPSESTNAPQPSSPLGGVFGAISKFFGAKKPQDQGKGETTQQEGAPNDGATAASTAQASSAGQEEAEEDDGDLTAASGGATVTSFGGEFVMCSMFKGHTLEDLSASAAAASAPARLRRLKGEFRLLRDGLPKNIVVKFNEENMNLFKVAIIGAQHTPYHDQFLCFDGALPESYPMESPAMHFHAMGRRINPNLYEDGKICLSLLGTWHAQGTTESWLPASSNVIQVLLSIQALILVKEPFYNEAGFEEHIGTERGRKESRLYNENAFLLRLEHQMEMAKTCPVDWATEFREHFLKSVPKLVRRLEKLLEQQRQCEEQPQQDSSGKSTATKKTAPITVDGLVLPLTKGFKHTLGKYLEVLRETYVQHRAEWREEAKKWMLDFPDDDDDDDHEGAKGGNSK